MHQETKLRYWEISDDSSNMKTIRELETRGMMIYSSSIHHSTVVYCYSCVASSGKLASKINHVVFMMNEKVRTFDEFHVHV